KPDEYLKKLYKTKKLVEKTSFSLQADLGNAKVFYLIFLAPNTSPLLSLTRDIITGFSTNFL
ncbi:hypothetical protein P8796_22245, partial [Bacillus subtilis]|uniref:hypothetical protein n=1 Tax=Bacillus subtilis TaxID=1423 RepID=UPI002DB851DC